MRKLIPLAVLASALLLVGCAPKNDYFVSTENLKKDQTNNYILANDFIDFIDDYYNPSTTKFVIEPDNQFSQYLEIIESRLREKGYGVGYANMNEAAWLAWKIYKVDDETIMVTYHIADSKYSKSYKMVHGKYAPYGAFTIFNEKPKNPSPTKLIEKNNVQPITPAPIPSKPSDAYSVFVKSNSYLHIREKPSINSKIVGTLKRATKIEGDEKFTHGDWEKIHTMEGFVSKHYLKSTHPKTEGDF